MTFGPLPPLALGGFYLLHMDSAIRAVFGSVGARVKRASAHRASLSAQPMDQGGFQLLVQRQHCRPEPPAQQGVGNALDTDTAFPIVQQKAVAAIIIAARMHQPPRFAVLLVIQDGDFLMLLGSRIVPSSSTWAAAPLTKTGSITSCMFPSKKIVNYIVY